MSDFLTRMAQLSRGEAPVIAPRLPSLFAPMEETSPVETIAGTVQQQTEAGSAVKTTLEPSAVDRDRPQPTTYDQRSAEQPTSNKPPTSQVDKIENVSTLLIAAQDNNDDVSAPLVTKKRDAPAITQPGISRSHTASPLLNEEIQPIASTTNADKPFDSAVDLNGQPDSAMPPPFMPLVKGYKTKDAAPQQIMVELSAATEPSIKQEPTVHINIGRVEVRAQTAAPAPASRLDRPKTHSSLSLNDYLKRGGGQS